MIDMWILRYLSGGKMKKETFMKIPKGTYRSMGGRGMKKGTPMMMRWTDTGTGLIALKKK